MLLVAFPYYVKADTAAISVSCDSTTVRPGDTISCTLEGVTDTEITEVVIKSTLSSQLTYTSFTRNDDKWQGDGDDGFISLYRADEVTGTFPIGVVRIKVNDNATEGQATIEFNNIKFSAGRKVINGTNNTTTITITNEVATSKGLQSLTPIGGTLGPQFVSTGKAYVLTIPGNATSFGLHAVAYDSDDEIVFLAGESKTPVTDPSNIAFTTDVGKTQMMVYIEVGSGNRMETYTIGVKKDVSAGISNELSSLTVGDQVVTLISGKYDDYNVILNDVSSYQVIADLNDRENFEIRNLDNLSPRSGEGPFTIIIDPKDSASGLEGVTYTINVVKSGDAPQPSSVKPSSSSHIVNPTTGGAAPIVMAIILIASFGVSIYYYRKNISYLSK